MTKKINPRNSRKDASGKSTKQLLTKVTPEEYVSFHALAWFRGQPLAELVRSLLKADLSKAESDGMRAELTRARELLAAIGGPHTTTKKRKG